MNFKYYHGTSTIFLDSIRKTGLGTINPNFDNKNLEILQFLYHQSEKHLVNNPEYKKLRETSKAMAHQGSYKFWVEELDKEISLNYSHKNIYVSLSKIRAVIYASTNNYGSEILERCLTLYQLLQNKLTDFKIPEALNKFNIEQYINGDYKPIIVEVLNLDDEFLKKEDGTDPTSLFRFLREELPYRAKKEQYEFPQGCNFKLLKPVPPENLRFYLLEYDGHPSDQRNFEWTLQPI